MGNALKAFGIVLFFTVIALYIMSPAALVNIWNMALAAAL